MNYTIYTDGSDRKHTTRRLGIGGILVEDIQGKYGKKIGEFSVELDREEIEKNYNTTECSNPFAELVAAHHALVKFSSIFKPGDKVVLKADYEGVKKWITGEWKAKAPYIKKVKEEIQYILSNSPFRITFEWIRGHQSIMDKDSFWNNEVDKLAKGIC